MVDAATATIDGQGTQVSERTTIVGEINQVEVDPGHEMIEQAARLLLDGGLVAFPTETVYGLGALALSPRAVRRIFEAKGRPATNPLICHVWSVDQARSLAAEWPELAQRLADEFWPGPLTIVVPRSSRVPDEVCAGLETVAIRMPAHPVARALIEAVGEPLAAPSANRYTEVSPTSAAHVLDGLEGRIEMVLDGGGCQVGLESTLVALVGDEIEILRPGMVGAEQLAEVARVRDFKAQVVDDLKARPSPGLSRRHYSPTAPVRVVEGGEFEGLRRGVGTKIGLLGLCGAGRSDGADRRFLPADPDGYARGLYGALRYLDRRGVDEIVIEAPPREGRWTAIYDRLARMGR